LMDFEYIHMYIYICIHIYMKEKWKFLKLL
jgi:hypothetical protein